MLQRMPPHTGDETCASCVVAGDFIFLAHHAGGFDKHDAAHQARAAFQGMQKTLEAAGASLQDMVQVTMYLRDLDDFSAARDVFTEFFPKGGAPARMTATSDFLSDACLVMMDGVAYRPRG